METQSTAPSIQRGCTWKRVEPRCQRLNEKAQGRDTYNTLVISQELIDRIRAAADESDIGQAPQLEGAPRVQSSAVFVREETVKRTARGRNSTGT